jgi:MFS family permease
LSTLESHTSYLDSIRCFRPNAKLFLTSVFFSQLAMASFGLILNLYLRNLGYSKTFLGIFTAVNLLSSGLVSIPAGMFSDRFGRKRALLLSLGIATVAALGQVFFTTSAIILLFFSAMRGASNTFKGIVQSPLLVENSSPRERMHLFSVNAALSHGSGMVGSSLGGLLPVFITDAFGITQRLDVVPLRWALIVSAVFWLVSAIPVFFMVGEQARKAAERARGGLLTALRKPIARNLAVYNIFIGFGAGLVVPFFNVFLTEQLQASTEQVGFVMAGSSVVLIFSVLFSPSLVQRLGKVRSVVLTQGLSLPLLVVMGLSPGIWPVTIAYWLRHGLMNMSGPITSSFAMEIVPKDERAATASLISMSNSLSRAISVVVGGYMMDNFGNGTPYFGTVIIYSMAVYWYFTHFSTEEARYNSALKAGMTAD